MKIAMLGIRGLPARYSGFETCAEQVGRRLVAAGHEVTAYCRRQHYTGAQPAQHLGIHLRYLPALRGKHTETLSHTALAAVCARDADAVVCFGVGNGPVVRAMGWCGRWCVFNVDGSDWERPKWGRLAATYLRVAEVLAAHSTSALVSDARAVQQRLRDRFGRDSAYIPYGAEPPADTGTSTLRKYGLTDRGYVLFVGRLEPENGADDLIAAAEWNDLRVPVVIVGGATYAEAYIGRLHQHASEAIRFTGFQFGSPYQQLTAHAGVFVFAAAVGGTHPVLVEQMAAGNCILARDTPSNREVLGDAGLWWKSVDELGSLLVSVTGDAQLRAEFGASARARQLELYDWDRVAVAYLRLCQRQVGHD